MTKYLGEHELTLLDSKAKHIVEDAHRAQIIATRASDVAVKVMKMAEDGASKVISAGADVAPDEVQFRRLQARVNMGTVLSLIGRHDTNVGHLLSDPVVVARNHSADGLTFSAIYANLHNVGIGEALRASSIRPFDARNVIFGSIREGGAILHATSDFVNDNRTHLVGRFSSWVARYEIPDTYSGREDYEAPSHMGLFARNMLAAMQDDILNPQFRTIGFISGLNPEVAALVRDTQVPKDEINVGLCLPMWLQEAASTSA